MCGRYTIIASPEALRALFRYQEQPNFPPRYNVAPTQPIAIVRLVAGQCHFALVRWGLLPSWGQGSEDLLAADQRARRIGGREAGVPRRHETAALPDSGRWFL